MHVRICIHLSSQVTKKILTFSEIWILLFYSPAASWTCPAISFFSFSSSASHSIPSLFLALSLSSALMSDACPFLLADLHSARKQRNSSSRTQAWRPPTSVRCVFSIVTICPIWNCILPVSEALVLLEWSIAFCLLRSREQRSTITSETSQTTGE